MLVAIVDVSLQVFAFAGDIPATAGLYMLISLAFWQAMKTRKLTESLLGLTAFY